MNKLQGGNDAGAGSVRRRRRLWPPLLASTYTALTDAGVKLHRAGFFFLLNANCLARV